MQRTQVIRCPNCGGVATRQFLSDEQLAHSQSDGEIVRTECPVCDYLMVMRSLDGTVVEAYAPGISAELSQKVVVNFSVQSPQRTNICDRLLRSSVKKPAA